MRQIQVDGRVHRGVRVDRLAAPEPPPKRRADHRVQSRELGLSDLATDGEPLVILVEVACHAQERLVGEVDQQLGLAGAREQLLDHLHLDPVQAERVEEDQRWLARDRLQDAVKTP
jgi:hypothetical protein